MAGGSEIAFRKICKKQGAGMTFTELVTAKGIRYNGNIKRMYRYLVISPEEFPVAIQLFGNEEKDFQIAIPLIMEDPLLSQCATIDINMGCPVKKVIKTGAGSALMKDAKRAEKIIKAAVEISPVPITVKFRKGFDETQINAVEFAKMCEASGASLITVHGRTTKQMYSGKADWDIIAKVKNAVLIPVIGNGDVTDFKSAKAMFDGTGVDGIMIGRAALGNPWIFSQLLAELSGEIEKNPFPFAKEKISLIIEHLDDSIKYFGEKTAVKEMKKHFSWYLKGMHDSNAIKVQLFLCSTRKEVVETLNRLIEN